MQPATQTEPSAPTMQCVTEPKLATYRIENVATARTLLNGFHTEIRFTDIPLSGAGIAEFGSREIAERVLAALKYSVRLTVVEHVWPPALDDTRLSRLCRQVSDTGASVNLLLWNPGRPMARALAEIRGRR